MKPQPQFLLSTDRPRRRLSGLALVLAILTTIAGPVAAANAATSPTSSSSSSSSSPSTAAAATQQPQRLPANAIAAKAESAPKQSTKPVQPAKAGPGATPSAAAQRAARTAAAHGLLAHDTVADTCSGTISPDTVYPCSAPSSTGTDTFTVNLSGPQDLLIFQVLSTSGNALPITITPPGGTAASCQAPAYYQLPACATNAAAAYTVQIANGGSAYTISYLPLLSDTTCATASASFADPTPLQGTVPAGSAGVCYTLDVPSGHILHADSNPNGSAGLVTVYDSTGTQICFDDQGDCTLTGVGPYRVVDNYTSGSAYTYAFRIKDITDPAGCLATAAGAYGVAPDSSSPVLCRTLTVTTDGNYQISAVSPTYSGISGTLYTPAGTSTCANSGTFCQLAAGTYDYVLDEAATFTDDFGVVFIAADQGQGCTATGDTDFQSGDATGTFAGTGAGAEVCLDLPTASGLSDYLDEQENADGSVGQVLFVVDATGAQQCSNSSFNYLVTCALSGTAPFRTVLAPGYETSAGAPDATYRLLVQRTDSTTGCAAWPQSGYGGSWGATVSLSLPNDLACLSIPAAQHSTGEMIDYANNANTVDGSINVFGPTGNQICVGNSTAICSYTAGVTYLALVYFAGAPGGSDTFHVVRRDVSQTAPCSTPASTAVGGASTSIELTSDLDAACERVTANAGDRLYLQVRTESSFQTGAVLEVANAAGTIVCRQQGSIGCPVSGSTSYQAVLIAENYEGTAIAAHLDTLLVGTSAGWAAQCTAHSLSAEGWAPFSGTVSESAASYCAVVSIQPGQWWSVDGADTATASEAPQVDMYSTEDWTPGEGLCLGRPSASCQASSSDTGQAVLIVSMGSVQGSTGFTYQGVCEQDCTTQPAFPTISSVSAAAQPQAGANTLVVQGTNLNLGTDLEFLSGGSAYYYASATPKSVSADGTSETYSVDSLNAAPGTYDLGVSSNGNPFCPPGQPSAQCLYGAYEITAGAGANSTFSPVTPDRILDTRKGTGAPQKPIAAAGTLALTVAGVDGVPATGVTAVDLDLTAVDEVTGGDLIAYADGAARPATSDLNFSKGQVITNLATIPVSQGKVEFYNSSGGTIDLVADIVGYTSASTTGSLYTGVTPARILDSAAGVGIAAGKVAVGATVPVTVAGAGGLPATGVSAVALDLTASGATVGGYLVAYPYGATRPTVTDLTYPAAQQVTNLVVVPVVQGKIDIYNAAGGPVDLSADVEGYYSASGSGYQPLGPERVLDTRSGLGGAGGTLASDGVALLWSSALTNVPATATSVVLDVVVVGAQDAGTVTVTQDGMALPGLSNLAYQPGSAVAGQVIVPVSGAFDFYNGSGGTIQVVADIEGYFTS